MSDKPRSDTLLVLLTMFDLVIAVVAGMPALMANIVKGGDGGATRLMLSVPFSAIVLLLVAWTFYAKGRPTPARLIAAVPLFWALTVFIMRGGAIV